MFKVTAAFLRTFPKFSFERIRNTLPFSPLHSSIQVLIEVWGIWFIAVSSPRGGISFRRPTSIISPSEEAVADCSLGLGQTFHFSRWCWFHTGFVRFSSCTLGSPKTTGWNSVSCYLLHLRIDHIRGHLRSTVAKSVFASGNRFFEAEFSEYWWWIFLIWRRIFLILRRNFPNELS